MQVQFLSDCLIAQREQSKKAESVFPILKLAKPRQGKKVVFHSVVVYDTTLYSNPLWI